MIAFRGSKIAQMPSAFRALPESPPKRSFAARDLPLRRRAKGDCASSLHFSTLTPGDNLAVSILQLQNFGQPTEYWLTASLRARGMLVTEALAWSGTRLIGHAPVARMSYPDCWAVLLPAAMSPNMEDHRAALTAHARQLAHEAGAQLVLGLRNEAYLAEAGLHRIPHAMATDVKGYRPEMYGVAPDHHSPDPFAYRGQSLRRAILPREFWQI